MPHGGGCGVRQARVCNALLAGMADPAGQPEQPTTQPGLRPDQLAVLEDAEPVPKQAPVEDGQLVAEPDHAHVSGASQVGAVVGNAAAAAALSARLAGDR